MAEVTADPATTVIPNAKPVTASPYSKMDRLLVCVALVLVLGLLDLVVVMWVCPVAMNLAEWAGMSPLQASYAGLIAMCASVPVLLIATILAARRIARYL